MTVYATNMGSGILSKVAGAGWEAVELDARPFLCAGFYPKFLEIHRIILYMF